MTPAQLPASLVSPWQGWTTLSYEAVVQFREKGKINPFHPVFPAYKQDVTTSPISSGRHRAQFHHRWSQGGSITLVLHRGKARGFPGLVLFQERVS